MPGGMEEGLGPEMEGGVGGELKGAGLEPHVEGAAVVGKILSAGQS